MSGGEGASAPPRWPGRHPATVQVAVRLARWLGPWTADDARPAGVTRARVPLAADGSGRPAMSLSVYRPARRRPVGALLVAPGLHYLGPDDPRLDAFLRKLAASGLIAACPHLPDYLALRVRPTVVVDFARALDAFTPLARAEAGTRVGVFSVSFGSLPALRVAATTAGADLGGLAVFGGFADWPATVRHALHGSAEPASPVPGDPLSRPVVFLNVLETVGAGLAAEARQACAAALRRFVMATWGEPAMKVSTRWHPVAQRELARVPEAARELTRQAVGLGPGDPELDASVLAAAEASSEALDPRPHLAGLRIPTLLVHGVDDDVIPPSQLEALARALPPTAPVRRFLTGLYGHAESRAGGPPRGMAIAREIGALAGVLEALASVATQPAARRPAHRSPSPEPKERCGE